MKITNLRTEIYEWPRPQVHYSGRGRGTEAYQKSRLRLVYIDTDEGITGIGSCLNQKEAEQFAPMLIGEDPLCTEKIWSKLYGSRNGRFYMKGISGIDVALWDLKAKAANMPLYKLLGGSRDKLDCYIAGGYYAKDKTTLDLQHEMEQYVEWNARAVKMKVGGLTPREDAERVHAVREVLGPKIRLLVDANCAWKYSEAIEFCKRVEDCYLYWFEEPLAATDNEGFIRLAAHTSIPLAAGESIETKFRHRDLIDTGAVSFIQPDAGSCGGVTEVMKIGSYADAHHIYIAPHGSQQVHVHLNCALPNAVITEFYAPTVNKFAYDAYKYPVRINEDGTVSPPDAPGIGLEPDTEFLKQYRVK